MAMGLNMKYTVSREDDSNGMTALHAAAHDGLVYVVKRHLHEGVSANVLDTEKSTPLHYLVKGKKPLDTFTQIMNVLLEKGADIKATNLQGYNVLFYATLTKMPKEFLRLLVAKGAVWKNITIRNSGKTIVHLAVEHSNYEALVYFLKELKADVNAKDSNGNTPIQICAITNSLIKVAKILLQNGADVTAVNNKGENILHLAAQKGKVNFMKCFVPPNPEINVIAAIDKKGNTPLHHALGNTKHFFEMVEYLVKTGFDINAVNADGESALYQAVRVGKTVVELEFLVSHGANLNVNNYPEGFSILHVAVNFDRLDALPFLLSLNGVEVNARNKTQDTPLMLIPFVNTGFCEMVHVLLDAGANINASNEYGDTLIFIAVEVGRTTSELETLLNLGADCNMRNNRGDTVLHVAARSNNVEAFTFFLQRVKLREDELRENTVITLFRNSLSD